MSKKKQRCLGMPKEALTPFTLKGVTYICVSGDLVNDKFVIKGSDGSKFIKKWNELEAVRKLQS